MDGRSFAPLWGQSSGRPDYVVTEYNENAGGNRHPMRSIITKDLHIFNPWSNGQRVMATATKGTVTYRRMQALAKPIRKVAARLTFFDHRVPEELYNYATDADALENLIAQPEFKAQRERLTSMLEAWMVKTQDPMLEVFRARADLSVRERYMKQVEREAASRNSSKEKGKKKGGKKKAAASSSADL
jgi:N-sulfoglucosamine sulfohydrolase